MIIKIIANYIVCDESFQLGANKNFVNYTELLNFHDPIKIEMEFSIWTEIWKINGQLKRFCKVHHKLYFSIVINIIDWNEEAFEMRMEQTELPMEINSKALQ